MGTRGESPAQLCFEELTPASAYETGRPTGKGHFSVGASKSNARARPTIYGRSIPDHVGSSESRRVFLEAISLIGVVVL